MIASIKRQIHGVAQLTLFDEELNKKILDDDIYANSLEWMIEFPEVLADTGKFLGFDAVIGNPPYIILTKNNTRLELLNLYKKLFSSIKKSNSKNIFTLFIETGISLIKPNGFLSLIIPEGLFKTRSYDDCTKVMSEQGATLQSITFESYVFENAITGSLVFLYQKGLFKAVCENFYFDSKFVLHKLEEKSNFLLDKIRSDTCELQTVSTIFKGMVVKNRNNLVSDNASNHKNIFLLGKNVAKWSIRSRLYTDFDSLEIIGGTKKLEKHNVFPRILVRRTGDSLCCALLQEPALTESTLYSCWSTDKQMDTKYLYALLNSSLLDYYNKELNITNQQGFPQILMTDLQTLPIKIPAEQQKPIIDLVDKILAAKAADHNADTSVDEHKIDLLVYHLYGLTFEEAKVIDPELKEEEFEALK